MLLSCKRDPTASVSWRRDFMAIGTNSSPRAADLTGDGVLDIVLGAGKNEGEDTEHGVIALDGHTGRLLWQVEATDQITGSAIFQDINQDGIPDVFIGGRNANLMGIDGWSGKVLWRYQKPTSTAGAIAYARFNFYNPQLIPDQNGDGISDLLISNGGNVAARAHSADLRFPGVLLILDARSGNPIFADIMPDGRETYMSPIIGPPIDPATSPSIYFGTGGETMGGGLYSGNLDLLRTGQLSQARLLIRENNHGFIAPPVLVDLNDDRTADLVAISHSGTVYAFDGKTDRLLWSRSFPGVESNTSPAPGYFTNRDTPDIFCHLSQGTWPNNQGTLQVLLDGSTGTILHADSVGCTGFYSPVAADLDEDGFDEALLSTNLFNCQRLGVTDIRHELLIFDFQKSQILPLGPSIQAKNVSTTPLLYDLDGDNRLDIVYTVQANTAVLLEFFGIAVFRLDTNIPVPASPFWGAYMGNRYDGVFDHAP